MFYATNGWGLGHISRTLALARQVKARDPESKFLFLTDSEATGIIWQEGFTSVKFLPAEAARRGLVDTNVKYALNPAIVMATVAAFRPDVLVVDAFPIGRTNELLGIFPSFARRAFIYGEKQPETLTDPNFARMLRQFEVILCQYEKDEVPLPAIDGPTVVWTGYFVVRSRGEIMARSVARRRLGLPENGFIVYVGFGGGGDDRYGDFLRWALKQANRRPDWTFAISLPPLSRFPPPSLDTKNVITFSYFPLAEVLSAFDAAISALGISSVAELLHLGMPTIFMPRPGLADDHLGRAARITKNGAGLVANALNDTELDAAVNVIADSAAREAISKAAMKMVPRNGAESAATFLLDWMRGSAPSCGDAGDAYGRHAT